jgi:hypothetical protein
LLPAYASTCPLSRQRSAASATAATSRTATGGLLAIETSFPAAMVEVEVAEVTRAAGAAYK